ncbi:hypothetical protein AHMF7605_24185 [Adhaeribacter arboris]|uniref:Uncharacterized protein n=1 Tax=Adhaeribacter arboris TaxID=2072846 RepID=A0A2T2YLJ3_9BACT|nr:hypothetical protein [Adhaeribacter arboris]PSR56374.1 hypothetical protein AHMF7605_24185 [Adhaeribacter arboris]
MFKTVTVYCMLVSYFLVVLVTNITTVNAVKYTHTYSAGKPYVHAPDCQQRYYLQFDCFEQCNNPVLSDAPDTPVNQYFYLLANGPDLHYLVPLVFTNVRYRVTVKMNFSRPKVFLTPGFAAIYCPPPNEI